jgi:DNA cross-link repair 1A protein
VAPSLQTTTCAQCPKEVDNASRIPVSQETGNTEHCLLGNTSSSNSNGYFGTSDTGAHIHSSTKEISPRNHKRPRPGSPTATFTSRATSSSVSALSTVSLKISSSESTTTTTVTAASTEEIIESSEQRSACNDTVDCASECSSDSRGSEGGNDLHCTQIVDLFEDDSEDDNNDDTNHNSSLEDDTKPLIHWHRNIQNGHHKHDERGAISETVVDFSEDEPLSNLLHRQEPLKNRGDYTDNHGEPGATLETIIDLSQEDEPLIKIHAERRVTSESIVDLSEDEPLSNLLHRQEPLEHHGDHAAKHDEPGATSETIVDLSQEDEPLINIHAERRVTSEKIVNLSRDEPLISFAQQRQEALGAAVSAHLATSAGGQKTDDDMSTCFVCGSSLTHITTGMKGRLNHVKRCSKKHGVTARDVRFDDDWELFTNNCDKESTAVQSSAAGSAVTATVRTANTSTTNNPYKRRSSWHGNDVSTSSGSPKQNSSSPAPPSVNNILMAGARNAAKVAQIKKATNASSSSTWQQNKRQWGNQPRVDYSKRDCPAYKKIPSTDFVCDGFQYARTAMTKNYFLTHFHSDHYGGITKAWNAGTIYCSIATANLVNQQLGIDRKFLHPMPMMTPIVVESRGKPVTVTLLDANHCPGAVMFLFEIGSNKNKKRILHVGDFRWNREFMMTQAPLRPFARGDCLLDELFLDTTYCDPQYTLPTQEEAIEETIKVAKQEVARAKQGKNRILMLFGAYTIGKERIYLSVAEALGMKVYVDRRRFRILSALGWSQDKLSILTTRPEESIIWVVPLGHINMKKIGSYSSIRTKSFSRDFDRVVGFRPTGWSLSSKGSGIVKTSTKGILTVHGVPYSEHSSFPELLDCLDCLKPRKIVPTVSASKSDAQVDLLVKSLKAKRISSII